MVGKNHIVAATSSLVFAGSTLSYLESHLKEEHFLNVLSPVAKTVSNYLIDVPKLPFIVTIIISLILYYIGTLLPDIDNENSTLGKYIHIPIEHRTWTHTIWVVLLFFVIGIWVRPLSWLALGYTVHLFWDSFSACGVCWFYPFKQYISYQNGAKIKKGHFLKLYWAGKTTETVFTVIVAILGVAVLALDVYIGIIEF